MTIALFVVGLLIGIAGAMFDFVLLLQNTPIEEVYYYSYYAVGAIVFFWLLSILNFINNRRLKLKKGFSAFQVAEAIAAHKKMFVVQIDDMFVKLYYVPEVYEILYLTAEHLQSKGEKFYLQMQGVGTQAHLGYLQEYLKTVGYVGLANYFSERKVKR